MTQHRVIERSEVHSGWLRVVREQVKHPNGGIQHYEIANPDSYSVSTVAFDNNDNIIMVELYRFAQRKRLKELPAGGVEQGEDHIDAIRRELLEETGYTGDFTAIGSHYIAAEHGVTRHVFVAKNCVKVAEPKPEQSEIDEGIVVLTVSLEEFKHLVRSGELTETAAGFMALDYLNLL